METIPDENMKISLPVRMSAISSVESGLARLHISHIEMFEGNEHPMAVISKDKKRIVVKIVADRFAPEGYITLRNKDMDSLGIREGDIIDLEPYSKLTDELKVSWNKLKDRFKKNDDGDAE